MEGDELNDFLESIAPITYQCYINDLVTIPPPTFPPNSIFYPTVTFFSFIWNMLVHIFFTLSTNLTMPISQPLNFLAVIVLYPLSIFIIYPLDFLLRTVNFLKLGKGARLYDERIWKQVIEPGGLSLYDIRENGKKFLGQPPPDEDPKLGQSPTFNLDMAETLLFLSTIIYQRDTDAVYNAYQILQERKFDLEEITSDDLETIVRLLDKSVEEIREYAINWGLEFQPLSELGSLGNHFAGMYWSKQHNFIVVTFKGTTPTNFTEWLTDFLFSRVDARSFVFGGLHSGFYNCLFPEDNHSTSRIFGSYPSRRIVEAVRDKAKEIALANHRDTGDNSDTDENLQQVNVWVTGHSLGAALAQVFYASLVKTNDLGRYAVMRDAFVFAGPAIGDSDFFSGFNSCLNLSYCENRTLWRIVNDNDIVPTLPPKPSNPRIRQYLTTNDVLNYFHIGDAVRFYQYKRKPESYRDIFGKIEDVSHIHKDSTWKDLMSMLHRMRMRNSKPRRHSLDSFVEKLPPHSYGGEVNYNIKIFGPLESLFPSPIRNHLPHRYFSAMERARDYFKNQEDTYM